MGEGREVRVLIHTPAAVKSVSGEFFVSYDHVKSFAFDWAARRGVSLTLGLAKNRTFPIDANRNEAVCVALMQGFTHVFFMDTDMTFQPDALVRLLEHERPIASGIYCLKRPPHWPVMFKLSESDPCYGLSLGEQRRLSANGRADTWAWFKPVGLWPDEGLFEVDMIGMGCCLIETRVFAELAGKGDAEFFAYAPCPRELRRLDTGAGRTAMPLIRSVTEDVHFWRRVRMETDYKVWIDPRVQCGHIREDILTPALYRAMLPGFIAGAGQRGKGALDALFCQFVDWKGDKVAQGDIGRIDEAIHRPGAAGAAGGDRAGAEAADRGLLAPAGG